MPMCMALAMWVQVILVVLMAVGFEGVDFLDDSLYFLERHE